jgi:hypothetical protein
MSQKKESNRRLGNKNSLSLIKSTVGNHLSRLEQVEDGISGFNDKIDIKEKNRRILRKKDSRPAKGICKNPVTTSKDKTCESWALKIERR